MTASTSPGASQPATRWVDLSITIAASPEAVWTAVSDGEWLSRWFSPIASVEPGEGGRVTVSWGDGEWTSHIVAWQPGVHMRMEYESPESSDDQDNQDDQGQNDAEEQPVVTALEYYLEPRKDGTKLRLVNSGFSASSEWDDYFRMASQGWRFFLWNLKHVLERHPGVPRAMISVRPWVTGSRAEVWDRLFSEVGEPGETRFCFALDGGVELTGSVILSDRPWAFAGVVESLNDGVFHVELEGTGDRWKLGLWLSAYGVDGPARDRVRQVLESTAARLFPAGQ